MCKYLNKESRCYECKHYLTDGLEEWCKLGIKKAIKENKFSQEEIKYLKRRGVIK